MRANAKPTTSRVHGIEKTCRNTPRGVDEHCGVHAGGGGGRAMRAPLQGQAEPCAHAGRGRRTRGDRRKGRQARNGINAADATQAFWATAQIHRDIQNLAMSFSTVPHEFVVCETSGSNVCAEDIFACMSRSRGSQLSDKLFSHIWKSLWKDPSRLNCALASNKNYEICNGR